MDNFFKSYWLVLTAIVKDRGVLLLVLIGPIIYSVYYPFPYSPEVLRNTEVAIIDLDHSSLSRKLIRLSDATPGLDIVFVGDSTIQLQQAIWDGSVIGGMIIPVGFRRDILHSKVVTPVVLGNGAYFMFNRAELLGFGAATQALPNELNRNQELSKSVSTHQAIERSNPVQVELRAASNPTGGYSTYVVTAVAVVVLQQTLLLGICMLMGTWQQKGSPCDLSIRENRIVLVIAAATICFINALYYVGIVYWREDYPHMGQLAHVLAVIAVFSLTTAAWTVAIASFIKFREQAVLHILPTTIPIIFVAGFAWPVELIPFPVRAVSMLVPSTAGIQAFLNVDQMGADLNQVIPELLSLVIILSGALFLILFKKRWPKYDRT